MAYLMKLFCFLLRRNKLAWISSDRETERLFLSDKISLHRREVQFETSEAQFWPNTCIFIGV